MSALTTTVPRHAAPHRARRRWVPFGLAAIALVLLLAVIWLVVTGLLARSQLTSARAEVRALRADVSAGDVAAATAEASTLADHARRAHNLTSGPVWALSADIPALGTPAKVVRGLTAAVDHVGRSALPPLVGVSRELDPSTLRSPTGAVNLAGLTSARPALATALSTLQQSLAAVNALPAHSWLGPVNRARADLGSQLGGLTQTVHSASISAQVLPTMLGASGPQYYFLVFQNEAEARGTGGLPGAFAIVEADGGSIHITKFEQDTVLFTTAATVRLGADYDALYRGARTETLYLNGNLSPNFPYAAQIWASMWQHESGQTVNGVIAVDPTALSYILAVTGPTTAPDGTLVSASNVVALTQSTVYAKFPTSDLARKAYLQSIAEGVSAKILDTRGQTRQLLTAAGEAAGQRRILVWSANPTVEAALMQTSLSGAIPQTTAPYLGLSIVNDGGNKLDYYLHRSLQWTATGCTPTRTSTATITLTNDAPASGLPAYVTERSDPHSYPTKPGDNRLEVSYFATDGATLSSVRVNGVASTANIGLQLGHPVFTVDLELSRGTSRTIVLTMREPTTTASPIVLDQPLVNPLSVSVSAPHCG